MNLLNLTRKGWYRSVDDAYPGFVYGSGPADHHGYGEHLAPEHDQQYADHEGYGGYEPYGWGEPEAYADGGDHGGYPGMAPFNIHDNEQLAGYFGQQLSHQAQYLHTVGELSRSMAADTMTRQIAGDLGPEAQEFIRDQLAELDLTGLAMLSRQPKAIELLKRAAKVEQYEKAPPGVAVPRSSGIDNPRGGYLDADSAKEIEAYYDAFKDLGVTQEMAVDAYRRTMGGGR